MSCPETLAGICCGCGWCRGSRWSSQGLWVSHLGSQRGPVLPAASWEPRIPLEPVNSVRNGHILPAGQGSPLSDGLAVD